MNSSKPMGLADRLRLLTSFMVVSPAAVAVGKSGRVILQMKQHVVMLQPHSAGGGGGGGAGRMVSCSLSLAMRRA